MTDAGNSTLVIQSVNIIQNLFQTYKIRLITRK